MVPPPSVKHWSHSATWRAPACYAISERKTHEWRCPEENASFSGIFHHLYHFIEWQSSAWHRKEASGCFRWVTLSLGTVEFAIKVLLFSGCFFSFQIFVLKNCNFVPQILRLIYTTISTKTPCLLPTCLQNILNRSWSNILHGEDRKLRRRSPFSSCD